MAWGSGGLNWRSIYWLTLFKDVTGRQTALPSYSILLIRISLSWLTRSSNHGWQSLFLTMANMGRNSIPWGWLGEQRIAVHYAGTFAQGLIWGLLHPKEAANTLSEHRLKLEQQAPMWQAAGLRISSEFPWAADEDFYRNCEEIVENYVHERRPLEPIPAELQAEPRLLRRLKGDTS